MSRAPDEGDLLGQDLADAVFAVMEGQRPEPISHARAAELLIQKGRLSGSPGALAPTLAAAVRADGIRRGAEGPRFRLVDGRLALAQWYLPSDAARLEREARRAGASQRDVVHRAYLKKIGELPTAAFAELMATWLNSEGVSALRAVRRPGSSGVELHLAGTIRRGQEEVRLAILVLRDGRDVRAERVVEIRGALHHYGNASMAWVVTTARAENGARQEVEVAGAPPVVLFDGRALAAAMEARSVGLRARALPLASIDLDLLDGLRGAPEDLGGRGGERGRERDDELERRREALSARRRPRPPPRASSTREDEGELGGGGRGPRGRRGGRGRAGGGRRGAASQAPPPPPRRRRGRQREEGAEEATEAAAAEAGEGAPEAAGEPGAEEEAEADEEDLDYGDEDERAPARRTRSTTISTGTTTKPTRTRTRSTSPRTRTTSRSTTRTTTKRTTRTSSARIPPRSSATSPTRTSTTRTTRRSRRRTEGSARPLPPERERRR
ncbi:MAG: restriction endonuclease [Sandaracinaceae bacterium]|nr:restriction endonuclease [Sandaracinaceae bacterium]